MSHILHIRLYVRGEVADPLTQLTPLLVVRLGSARPAFTGIGVASLATPDSSRSRQSPAFGSGRRSACVASKRREGEELARTGLLLILPLAHCRRGPRDRYSLDLGFQLVTVRVERERGEVRFPVVRTQARRSCVLPAVPEGGRVKALHGVPRGRRKRHVKAGTGGEPFGGVRV